MRGVCPVCGTPVQPQPGRGQPRRYCSSRCKSRAARDRRIDPVTVGADCVLECVGTEGARLQAVGAVRDGGNIGLVGVPHGDLPVNDLFWRNVGVKGGPAHVRAYLPHLLELVLTRTIDPGKVFDLELPLAEVAEAYAAMDERRAIKVLLRP